MNLSIIYIFALFVIFTPHFIFKHLHKNKYAFLIYSFLFSIVFYLTYDVVIHKEIEGASLTTYDIYGNQEKVNAPNILLGNVELDHGYTSLTKPENIIYPHVENPFVMATPATSAPNLTNRFKLQQQIDTLFQHNHDEPYKRNMKEVLCAADYGKDKACCGQPPANVPKENVCPIEKPFCKGYVSEEKWGKCVKHNPDAPPDLKYVEKGSGSCRNLDELCSIMGRCCPGGPGSDSTVTCKTEDCPVKGERCVGTWMEKNCPSTCKLCKDSETWDGDISGFYVADTLLKNRNSDLNDYVTIKKIDENHFSWNNRAGAKWLLKRFSNTESFLVTNYPNDQWNMTRVILNDNNDILSILGPGNKPFVKRRYEEEDEKYSNSFQKILDSMTRVF